MKRRSRARLLLARIVPAGIGAAGVVLVAAVLVTGALFAAPQASPQAQQVRFPHDRHASVFPLCATCHAGVTQTGQPMFPDPSQCAACHDGVVKPRIPWQPRVGPRPGNRRFTHEAHSRAAAAAITADSTLIRNCSACHTVTGTPRMAVRNAVVGQCLACHGFTAPHVDIPNDACAKCHVRLTDAPSLTRDEIATFPKPASHGAPGWILGGHGKAAKVPGNPAGTLAIASSCATCHARNLCLTCHVNAPESPAIRALALDERPPVYRATQPVPSSHAASGWLRAHGRDAQRPGTTCAICHAKESCVSCHIGLPPGPIATLPGAGPGRAPGAQLTRAAPANHSLDWKNRHGPDANARPAQCETCHVRQTCLECHRSEGARQSRYHPQGFLTRHPSSAYAREANCSDCHNPAQFCQSCHQQAGLVATSRLGPSGYHDAFRGFSLGHGQAARQSLESCAACHAERDCTACHSAVGGGFRFSPHGPGFNASRARSKNPSVCVACHGRVIPGGG
jgi:hypothetical protein